MALEFDCSEVSEECSIVSEFQFKKKELNDKKETRGL